MKKLVYILLISLVVACNATDSSNADEKIFTTFILVRHAEKADDGTKNPPLTEVGKLRAQALADLLRDAEVNALYSTDYIRTKETLGPLSQNKQLPIQNYKPFDFDELQKILDNNAGKTVLISGHSNSIPWTVNMYLGNEVMKDFGEADYDNLIVLFVERMGHAKMLHLNYGEATIPHY